MTTNLSSSSIAYIKPIIRDGSDEDIIILSDEDSMAETPFNEDLIVTYLVNDYENNLFKYIQNRHLIEEGISKEELAENGLRNLYKLIIEKQLRIQEYQRGLYALFLEGNFEASLILLDDLWNNTLKNYVTSGFAVIIPSRDVIAFCDINNNEAISQLDLIINRVWESNDHLLINKILFRTDNEWSYTR